MMPEDHEDAITMRREYLQAGVLLKVLSESGHGKRIPSASGLLRWRGDAVRWLPARLADRARLALDACLDPDHLSKLLDNGGHVFAKNAGRLGDAADAEPAASERFQYVFSVVC